MYMMFQHSISTTKRTYDIVILRTNIIMMFKEIILLCYENNTEHINELCGHGAPICIMPTWCVH